MFYHGVAPMQLCVAVVVSLQVFMWIDRWSSRYSGCKPRIFYAHMSLGIHDIVLEPSVVAVQTLLPRIQAETDQDTSRDSPKLSYTYALCCESWTI